MQTFTVEQKSNINDWLVYKEDIRDPGEGKPVQLRVTNLQPDVAYSIMIIAVNSLGQSNPHMLGVETRGKTPEKYDKILCLHISIAYSPFGCFIHQRPALTTNLHNINTWQTCFGYLFESIAGINNRNEFSRFSVSSRGFNSRPGRQ